MPAARQWYACSHCGFITYSEAEDKGSCPECSRALTELDADCPSPRLATRLLRLAGYLADQAVLGLMLVPALYLAGALEAHHRGGIGVFLSAYGWAMVAFTAYYIVPTALWGQTLGKWFVGIKVVGPTGKAPGWGRAFIRRIIASIADSAFPMGIIDPIWLIWDPNRQALHDKAAGTVVTISRQRRPVVMLVVSILLAVASQVGLVFAVIRPFIIQAYYVPSGSMHYTLMEDDRLLVNKLSYKYGDLRRRDIVVFRPPDYVYEAGPFSRKREDFIKRLIALPGDTLQVEDHRLFINGHTVEEPYLAERYIDYTWGPVTVPPDHVVVLGDNRNNSNDAHAWTDRGKPAPFLPIQNIRGRALFRFWPLPRMGPLAGGEAWPSTETE